MATITIYNDDMDQAKRTLRSLARKNRLFMSTSGRGATDDFALTAQIRTNHDDDVLVTLTSNNYTRASLDEMVTPAMRKRTVRALLDKWDGHCGRLLPEAEELDDLIRHADHVARVEIECDEGAITTEIYRVDGRLFSTTLYRSVGVERSLIEVGGHAHDTLSLAESFLEELRGENCRCVDECDCDRSPMVQVFCRNEELRRDIAARLIKESTAVAQRAGRPIASQKAGSHT